MATMRWCWTTLFCSTASSSGFHTTTTENSRARMPFSCTSSTKPTKGATRDTIPSGRDQKFVVDGVQSKEGVHPSDGLLEPCQAAVQDGHARLATKIPLVLRRRAA